VQQITNHEFVISTRLLLHANNTRPETKRVVDYTPARGESFEETLLGIPAKACFRPDEHLQANSAQSRNVFYSMDLPYTDGSVVLPSVQNEFTPLCSRCYKYLQANEPLRENEGDHLQHVSKL
jgi:hypothetical protein